MGYAPASMIRLSSAVRLAALACFLAPAAALAQCPRPAETTLTDASGAEWDVNRQGMIVSGTDGAFEGGFQLFVNGMPFDPYIAGSSFSITPHPDGLGILINFPAPITDAPRIVVQRHLWAPPGEGFLRYVDTFVIMDPTMSRTIDVEYRTNVGWDDRNEVVTTTDGDVMLESTDTFYVLDNEFERDDAGRPYETPPSAFCHVLSGPGATVLPTLSSGAGVSCGGMFGTDSAGTRVRFSIALSGTNPIARVMFFAAQRPTRADASAFCPTLATLTTARYADLDDDARRTVINWGLDRRNGAACGSAADCVSGQCVDGVCCDGPCAGGTGDCQACARAAGAPTDGTCAPIASSRTCRPAAGPCDFAETCDGSTTACPADRLRPAATPCRVATGLCDRAESCTGTNPACPPDTVFPRGQVCAPALPLSCDFGARCDGATGVCPAPTIGDPGAPCDDGLPCTYARCEGTSCVSATVSCDDQDPCTTDSCADSICTNAYMSGCVGGRDAGPDGGELYPDAPEPDGGDPFLDAGGDLDGAIALDASSGSEAGVGMDGGVRSDAGPDAVRLGGGGCVCRAGPPRPGLTTALALGAALAFLLRARRR